MRIINFTNSKNIKEINLCHENLGGGNTLTTVKHAPKLISIIILRK